MEYLLPFILALLVTMLALTALMRVADRWLPVDHPGERKVHSVPIPRIGGLAMACGVVVAAITLNLQAEDRWFLFGCSVLTLFGALDDRFDLDYRIKLVGQLIAVILVVTLGDAQIRSITLDERIILPAYVAVPLTMLFLIGVTNAINLADGLDGLAGGTTFLCLCAIALLSRLGDSGACPALALVFGGAVLGFLRFNTYPARVFMGDAGSQLLGFAIGVLSIRATQTGTTPVSAAVPVLLLALPVLDTLSVMIQRLSEGRSPFSADRNHIHHKLLALGLHHHEAVTLIYVVQAALFVAAYTLRYESDLLILGVVIAFFAAFIGALQIATRAGWQVRHPERTATVRLTGRIAEAVRSARLLPRMSLAAIAVALALYASLVVGDARVLSADVRTLVIGLLIMVAGLLVVRGRKPLSLPEKVMLYVTATVLVYLDTLMPPASRWTQAVSWTAIVIAALATAVRLRLSREQRFELTPLDLIVLFMALVVPNIPGSLGLPHGAATAIAKLVVVFYAVEILVNRAAHRGIWVRAATAALLIGLMLR